MKITCRPAAAPMPAGDPRPAVPGKDGPQGLHGVLPRTESSAKNACCNCYSRDTTWHGLAPFFAAVAFT